MVSVLCVQVKVTEEKFKLITIYLESNDNSVIDIAAKLSQSVQPGDLDPL